MVATAVKNTLRILVFGTSNLSDKVESVMPHLGRSVQRGFTLVEILVVLVVLALFTGLTVISIGDNSARQLKDEAERLQSLVVAAMDESVFSSADLGILVTKNGYQIAQLDRLINRWQVLQSGPFKKHTVTENIKIEWRVDGFEAFDSRSIGFNEGSDSSAFDFLNDQQASSLDQASLADLERQSQSTTSSGSYLDRPPQIVITSAGDMPAFRISFLRNIEEEGADRLRENEIYGFSVTSDGFSDPALSPVEYGDE